jgi:putative ABC transporter-associated repeat protein
VTTVIALLGSSLAFQAPAAASAATVQLDGATLPALAATEQGLALLALDHDSVIDPAATAFEATAGVESRSRLLIDTAALPDGTRMTGATFTLEAQDGPGDTARIETVANDGTRTPWSSDTGATGAATELTSTADGVADLAWTFDRPGTYTVEILASVSVIAAAAGSAHEEAAPGSPEPAAEAGDPDAPAHGSETPAPTVPPTSVEPFAPIDVRASYVIDVAPPSTDPSAHDGFVTSDAATADDAQPSNEPSIDAAGPSTVVSAGDIRITSQIENGRLQQSLAEVVGGGSASPLDPASVVFAVPLSESWPGTAEDAAVWEKAAPEKGAVYRTSAGGLGVNALSFSLDANAVAPDAVVGAPGWGDSSGGLYSRLGSVSGPGNAAVLHGGTGFAGSSASGADTSVWLETSPPGGFLFEPVQPVAFVFEQPGRYCVSVEGMTQRNADGAVLNDDLTLTIAVGEIDAASVVPCAQPVDIETVPSQPAHADPAPVVIGAGEVRIASTLEGHQLSLDIVTLDRGRATSHDTADVVFSIPNQDTRWPGRDGADTLWQVVAPTGTRLWRTVGYSGSGEIGEQANPLSIALEGGYIDSSALGDTDSVGFRLLAATTPETGYVATYRTNSGGGIDDPDRAATWDSRPGGKRDTVGALISNRDMGYPFAPIRPDGHQGTTGFAFSAPGVYCLTLGATALLADGTVVEDIGTVTFAVGIDASSVTPCTPGGDPGEGPDPVDPTDPEPGDLDPTVTWFDHGHLDLQARVDETGEFGLASVGDAYDHQPVSLDDSVWVANSRFTAFTVPEPDELQDLTFLGEPGATYYGFSSSPTFVATALWPGINTQGLPASYYDRAFTWTVSNIDGPGDVSVYTGSQKRSGTEFFDSRHLPGSFTTGNSHVHENWSFTAPGVYCIDISVTARPVGQSVNDIAAGRLTVAVGDIDLSTVQPCGRTGSAPTATSPQSATLDETKTVVAGGTTGRTTRVELSMRGKTFDVAANIPADLGSRRQLIDVERVVWSFGRSGTTWHHLQEWSALPVPVAALRGDISVTLNDVTGPGDYYADETRLVESSTPTLDTREGQELRDEKMFPERLIRMNQQFTVAGVYCLPFTWSATAADGTPIRVTKTLTVAAGVDDASNVELCADGGEGTDPGEGPDPDPGTPVEWDVPNHSTTKSGATIITDGHVDIASRIENGALTTAVKDDSDALAGTVFRNPGNIVLQVRPAAETTVPPQAAFAFLGSAGSPVWQVEQVQQEGLLWPGWSTELIRAGVIQDGVRWSLRDMEGPGEFALYETDFGAPTVFFNTRDGITAADAFTIPPSVHAHGNWAFSAEGVYCLAFQRSTTLADGAAARSDFILAVAVGRTTIRNIDPAACFTAPPGEPTTPDVSPIPAAQLTDTTMGDVEVLGGADGFAPGQLVTVRVGKQHAGEWVSVWLHSDPRWLGWRQVGVSGALQARLPADAALGAHRLVVKTPPGSLLGWDTLSIVAAPTTPPPASGSAPSTASPPVAVAASQCVAGATILSSGHIDYASRIVGGELRSFVGDDSSGTKVYREPAGVVLWLKPESRLTLPTGYQQVGAPGSTVWQVPQTQNPALIWLGWNTEALNAGNTSSPISWRLDSVDGPGSVTVYSSGSFGGVQQVVLAGSGSSYAIPPGVHAHANWAFSAEGVYRLRMTQAVTLADGTRSSDTQTLTIAVGDVDPARAIAGNGAGCGSVSSAVLAGDDTTAAAEKAAAQAAADAAEAGRMVMPGRSTVENGVTNPFEALAEGNPVPLLLTILGGLLLAGAGFAGVLWWRRRGIRPSTATGGA